MRNKKPPFEITNAMIDHVAEIAELVGRLTSTNQLSANPTLRRTNRIRTIHGSLAIEQNTLTLEQVTGCSPMASRFWLRLKILQRSRTLTKSMSDWTSLIPFLWMTC